MTWFKDVGVQVITTKHSFRHFTNVTSLLQS